MTRPNQPQNPSSDQRQNGNLDEQETKQTEDTSPAAVDPRDLAYNAGTVDNPDELLDRPNVTPQTQADNDRAI